VDCEQRRRVRSGDAARRSPFAPAPRSAIRRTRYVSARRVLGQRNLHAPAEPVGVADDSVQAQVHMVWIVDKSVVHVRARPHVAPRRRSALAHLTFAAVCRRPRICDTTCRDAHTAGRERHGSRPRAAGDPARTLCVGSPGRDGQRSILIITCTWSARQSWPRHPRPDFNGRGDRDDKSEQRSSILRYVARRTGRDGYTSRLYAWGGGTSASR
jgi:hypothetical protein